MADNSPWAGISNINADSNAIDQKLYQSTRTETPPLSPTSEKQETGLTKKAEKRNKTATVETMTKVVEQEIRMTLPLPASSLTLLDEIERTIFTKRDIKLRSKQRITKNNVVRDWISLLKEVEIDWTNIKDDTDLTARLRKTLKIKM
jgi:ABC-type dipeptide/oligopeptide/nickel transport system ATPase component